ncbi:winged helix DNA-binding protein [Streptomyces termitum]|uniref:Methionyl-tRNA formyltransferase n=1 Tax=Streptomyces termitum TaxID=67368 RepID=A0A918WA26_9ACTN|nr:winged helix DNA-binding protein [Streptomyces termitum]GHA87592.1 hypothetical protein GCM10010305_34050 [Streptomyces termitum]
MEQPALSGVAYDASGASFAVVGISNMPGTDWSQVFRALAGTGLTLPDGVPPPPPAGSRTASGAETSPRLSMTPPGVLNLNAYLMYAVGKAARRRLTERLAAHNLRLWHLTVLALVADLGPQMKTVLAARLDMNPSDLVKIVNDLVRTGHVDCARDPANRRRVLVRPTPEGRTYLARLNADIASADDEVLAPLDARERETLAALLRRVHRHLEPSPASVVHDPSRDVEVLSGGSDEDGRIDWTRPAEDIARFVGARRALCPTAFTHHGGRRLGVLTASVSHGRHTGEPGLVLRNGDEGVVVVAGPDHGEPRPGVVLGLVRPETGGGSGAEGGGEARAEEYFAAGGR